MNINGCLLAKCFVRNLTIDYCFIIAMPTNYLNIFGSSITKKWRQLWTDQKSSRNKLAIIEPTRIPWSSSNLKSCRLEKIVTRLRIGHTRLTHSHLISQFFPLTCNFWNTDNPLTTHLFFYPYLATTRKAHQVPSSPVQALANDPSQLSNTFFSLQAIQLLHKI